MKGVPPRTKLSKENLLSRGVPRLFLKANINEYSINSKVKDVISNYLSNIDVMFEDCINLILYGKNGNGKSYCASLIVKEAYIQRYTSYIITFQSLLNLQLRSSEEKDKLDNYYNAEFLVIDELGKEIQAKSGFNKIILEELLRIRDTKGLPTIICANISLEDIEKQYSSSIASLIKGNFLKVEFKDKDYRNTVTENKRGIQLLLGNGELKIEKGE